MDRKEGVALESDSLFLKTNCQNFQQLFMHSQTDHGIRSNGPRFVFENSVKWFQSCKNNIKTSYSHISRTFFTFRLLK